MIKRMSIRGEHASVKTLTAVQQAKRFGKKTNSKINLTKQAIATKMKLGTIVRRKHLKKGQYVPASYSAAMSLANLLFPKNFPKMIATGLKRRNQQHSSISYSKLVPLTQESQKGIESFYGEVLNKKPKSVKGTKYNEHSKKISQKLFETSMKIEESGIVLNNSPMNVGVRKSIGKELVFFEIGGIDLKKLHRYIRKLPQTTKAQKLTKDQAWVLFKFLKTQPVEADGLVHTHTRIKK